MFEKETTVNPPIRLILFCIGIAALATMYALSIAKLPGPDDLRDRYLNAIDARSVQLRNTSDAVSAVNFDFRGFDTLGEEFILFASVVGAVVLLREAESARGKRVARCDRTGARRAAERQHARLDRLRWSGRKFCGEFTSSRTASFRPAADFRAA